MRALVLLLALLGGPVLAQEAPMVPAPAAAPAAADPLGDLITQSGPQTTDEEETAPPAPPPQAAAPAPTPAPSGAAIPVDQAYELRIKGSIAAAQGLQGPLDGGWTVAGPDGTALYGLQIVDPAGGERPLEGAWRDMRRPGAVGSTGLVETLERTDGGVVARFSPRPDHAVVLTLTPEDEIRWRGDLVEGAARTRVVATREAPPSLPPGFVVKSRGPVVWPPRAAAPVRAAAPACSIKGKTGKALKAAKARCAAARKAGSKGKAVAKGKKGSKAKATPAKKRKKKR